MTVNEARELKIGDILTHRFLKTEWVVAEVRLYKSNEARFRHVLKQGWRKYTFTEKGLHLWVAVK